SDKEGPETRRAVGSFLEGRGLGTITGAGCDRAVFNCSRNLAILAGSKSLFSQLLKIFSAAANCLVRINRLTWSWPPRPIPANFLRRAGEGPIFSCFANICRNFVIVVTRPIFCAPQ